MIKFDEKSIMIAIILQIFFLFRLLLYLFLIFYDRLRSSNLDEKIKMCVFIDNNMSLMFVIHVRCLNIVVKKYEKIKNV